MTKKIGTICSIIILGGVFTGCQPVRVVRTEPLQNSVHRATAGRLSPSLEHWYTSENHVDQFSQKQTTRLERIVNLENHVTQITGVDTASVVIIENAAIVSISIENGIGKPGIAPLREEVSRQVKQIDPDIQYVSVTVSPELVQRYHELRDQANDQVISPENQPDNITNFRPAI